MTIGNARTALAFAGLSGAVGVAAGAWASHAGEAAIGPEMVRLVGIGARYQLIHALALLGSAVLSVVWPGRLVRLATVLFGAGTLLFCGSLYLLAASAAPVIGMATPLGGLCLIAGWVALAAHGARGPR